jgi:hypothetical protein
MQFVVAGLLAAAYFLLASRAGGRATRGTGLLAAAVIAQAAYLVYVGGDSHDVALSDRYLCVVVPFLFVLAVLGARRLADLDAQATAPMAVVGLVVIAAGVFVDWSVLPVERLQLIRSPHWQLSNWAVLLWVVGGSIVVFALLRWPARLRALAIAVTVLVVGMVVTTNGVQDQPWVSSSYYGYNVNVFVATLGVRIARATAPGTSVAVTGAGNTVFFDHRTAIDIDGYSDHIIAVSKPHTIAYVAP